MIRAVSRPEYSLICESNVVSPRSGTAFSTRPVSRPAMIDLTPFEEIESYVKNLKVQLESLIPKRSYRDVIRLFYQYKHLNSIDLANLPPTDFIIHKMKLISEIKFYSVEQCR